MNKKIIMIMIFIIWMGMIFVLSNMNAVKSGGMSLSIIKNTIKNVLQITNKIGITNKNISDRDLDIIARKWNNPFRKITHAFVYLILAIFVMLMLRNFNLSMPKAIILTILICFVYSLTDEFHQTFIQGRSGEFMDCLIDTAGSACGITIYLISHSFLLHRRNKNVTKT